MTIELGYFQRQALIERLTRKFAKIRGYDIEESLRVIDSENAQIKVWIMMVEAAIDEIENAFSDKPESEIVRNFIAKHDSESHTGEEWEKLAAAEGLDEDGINELMDYLDDYH